MTNNAGMGAVRDGDDDNDDDDDTASPDGKAVARLRDSFMQLAEEHDPSRLSPKK